MLKLLESDLDIQEIYKLLYPEALSDSIIRSYDEYGLDNESIGHFAERMKGFNDTLHGIIKDIIKKGRGENLTRSYPHLLAWIEKEASDELQRGQEIVNENLRDSNGIEIEWFPEIEAYTIVVYMLDKFVSLSRSMQQRIAGGL
jgi:hypothetical protein